MFGLTWEQTLAYGIAWCIGMAIAIKVIKDREKGKSDSFSSIPLLGGFMRFDAWKPSNHHQWNIIFGKLLVFSNMILALIMTKYSWIFYILALMAVAYHLEYLSED